MDLRKYLKMTKTTVEDLCKMAEVTRPTMYSVLNKKDVLLSSALKISQATNSTVTIYDMLPDLQYMKKNIAK